MPALKRLLKSATRAEFTRLGKSGEGALSGDPGAAEAPAATIDPLPAELDRAIQQERLTACASFVAAIVAAALLLFRGAALWQTAALLALLLAALCLLARSARRLGQMQLLRVILAGLEPGAAKTVTRIVGSAAE